jgi:acetyl-CoA C-acetyltransferase/acetyl-CoA acyltransferase
MRERIAIVDGVRTPFSKAGGALKDISADDLGAIPVKELLFRLNWNPADLDEVIIGNVAQPANAANIARVIALKAGIPKGVPAYTVHRNCASGMESVTSAANKILAGEASVILAGGTESMSNIPLLYNARATRWFDALSRAKKPFDKLKLFACLPLKSFLTPVIGVMEGLTDPTCGLIMGLTAENIAREFRITREAQDQYALDSHLKAVAGQSLLQEEIVPVVHPSDAGDKVLSLDDGPRASQSLTALGKLKPYFDRKNGTVTVGNACPLTDGAAAVLLMTESRAKSLGLPVLGYLRDYAYAGLDPERMGLGPVYASSVVLEKSGLTVADMDLVEMNEAFAAQILANLAAFASPEFGRQYLGIEGALGAIDPTILNVNGGAVALGHPVGVSGTRLIITLLKELRRRGKQRGLATLCIGGGQGAALILEVN